MDKKYYLDESGVIKLLQGISKNINDRTSNKIIVNSVEDPQTGEITEEIVNPKNFATTEAVVNYVAKSSRRKLTINQQSTNTVSDPDLGTYTVVDHSIEYDGSEQVQINFNLIRKEDINELFRKEVELIDD